VIWSRNTSFGRCRGANEGYQKFGDLFQLSREPEQQSIEPPPSPKKGPTIISEPEFATAFDLTTAQSWSRQMGE